ncbi:transcriptional adapter 2-beta isoform X1 [Microplitis mediator]|uniref:transcriptional adapter 2-beta isoform X1 n=1 Tax=Microplitis mediator TaxID=375433 RepID=UPI0025566679|nr:transcriptional adapter 2-beta isoform X1 [Microplitis mediator]
MADLYAKYTCTYCQEDITGLRVKCVECQYFDLCLQCFSAGAEIGQHKNDHSYQFMDSGTISIFNGSRGNWTAREHLRLLDAIEQFGFGNWEDISKHIETRTPEEAKEQYIARYLEGNIGKYTWPPRQRRSSSSSSTSECYTPNLTDQTTSADHGPLSPDLTSKLPPLDITPEEAQQLGYMPQRDDFERDYNHEAESLVSSLFLNPAEDDDLDIALKLAHVDMYTNNLRERARRKRVVRDYQLVSNFFLSSRRGDNASVNSNSITSSNKGIKKRQTKEEKDFRERMRIFAQFYTAQEHEQFLTNLEKERDLRLRLSELYRYRENGITRHEECAHFEQVMAVQNSSEIANSDHWIDKKSGSSGPTSSTPMHRHTSKKKDEEKNCSSIGRKFTTKASSTSNSTVESAQNNSSGGSSFTTANNSSSQSRTTTPVNQSGTGAAELDGVSPASHHQGSTSLAKQKSSVHNGGVTQQQTTCTKPMKNLDLQPNNIDLEAAAHLLTQQEKTLCLQLDLKPTQYLTQKALIIQEYLSSGSGGRRSNFMAHSEPENKILHYLVSNGWIAAAT